MAQYIIFPSPSGKGSDMHRASGCVRREWKGCICLRGSEKGEEKDVNSLSTGWPVSWF